MIVENEDFLPNRIADMHIPPGSIKVIAASHYHQPARVHPTPLIIPQYYERLELVTDGRGAIWHEGVWREVTPGDLIWNRPGDATIGRSDWENPYRCLAVTLMGPEERGHEIPRFSRWEDGEEVLRFTHEVVRFYQDERFSPAVYRGYFLGRVLFQIQRWHAEQQPELPGPVRVALQWISRNHRGPCPAAAVARACGWSVPHLREAFRRHLGFTPHQAVLRERLRSARERLVSSTLPMKQIAHECGFGDAPAFSRHFRAATGLSPGAYRKRYLTLAGLPHPKKP